MVETRETLIVDTLQAIHHISNLNIFNNEGKIVVSLNLNDFQIIIYINASGAVEGCTVCGWKDAKQIDDLILEAKKLPIPQDFRYLIFSLKTLLNRNSIVNQHILDIQSTCVVKRDMELTSKLYLLTENGIKCTVNLSSCYPQVPGGVTVESLSISKYNNIESLDNGVNIEKSLKDELNCCLYRSIPELVGAMQSIHTNPNSNFALSQ